MDFSLIPDHIVLQIFRCLPLGDRIRAGGVCVNFRRMSGITVSETKLIDLNEIPLRDITPRAFASLLNSCHTRLEEVRCDYNHQYPRCLLDVLMEYSCPHLKKLSSHCECKLAILLRNNANILLSLSIGSKIRFPEGVITERLEMLNCWCEDINLRTLLGRTPNLKHLKVKSYRLSPGMLDSFFGTVPRLESFQIFVEVANEAVLDFVGNGMTAFWNLKSLKRLDVGYTESVQLPCVAVIDDDALARLVASFPRLRVLSLCHVTSGNNGVVALSSLQDLRLLKLEKARKDIDVGLRELSKCQRLEKLEINGPEKGPMRILWVDTVMTLLQSCPRLSFISFDDFATVTTEKAAASFIASLARLEKSAITFRLNSQLLQTRRMWKSSQVEKAVQELREMSGLVVQVLFYPVPTM